MNTDLKHKALFQDHQDESKKWVYISSKSLSIPTDQTRLTPWLPFVGMKYDTGQDIYEHEIVSYVDELGGFKTYYRIEMYQGCWSLLHMAFTYAGDKEPLKLYDHREAITYEGNIYEHRYLLDNK